jgi:hypothetical protein
MINPELLSLVINRKLRFVNEDDLEKDTIIYGVFTTDEWLSISKGELAHLCKQWAYRHHEQLWSCIDEKRGAICRVNNVEQTEFYAETEPEAVFKCCLWILER